MDVIEAQVRDSEHMLLEFLRERDVACPLCGYNLRNLTLPRCPECGRGLMLGIGLTEPYLAAWVTGMISLAMGGGVGLLFLMALIASKGHIEGAQLIAGICFTVCVPLALAWMLRRRRILQWGRGAQWVCATASLVVLLFAFALMVVDMIR